MSPWRQAGIPPGVTVAGLALFGMLLTLAISGAFGTDWRVQGAANPDNFLRLANVRDLLAGQSWFDLVQSRIGPMPGLLQHWSRLVDAPIAGLVLLGDFIMQGGGETFAAWAWPVLCLFASNLAILHALRRLDPEVSLFPGVIIGSFALLSGGVFTPGSFDHHGIQVALCLSYASCLLPGPHPSAHAGAAALFAVIMLAIGMETLPYVVAGAAWLVYRLATEPDQSSRYARTFGLTLALSGGVLFVLLVPPGRYADGACDAFSLFHLVAAMAGGLSLMLVSGLVPNAPNKLMKAALAAFPGLLVLLLVAVFFRDCLQDPLASLDPRLKTFWLDSVIEAQGIGKLVQLDPSLLPGLFGLPLVAVFVCARAFQMEQFRPQHALYLVLNLTALAVTCWQMRGSTFGLPLAAVPLAAWVARLMAREPAVPVRRVAAWVTSLSLSWSLAGTLGAQLFNDGKTITSMAALPKESGSCHSPENFTAIGELQPATILGTMSIGSDILLNTPHRAMAAPYHRNTTGNLALIDVMTGSAGEARAKLQALGISIIAVCEGGADETDFLNASPQGFLGQLTNGVQFDWLEPVETRQNQPLRFWRLKS
jgi:hypothetical protein